MCVEGRASRYERGPNDQIRTFDPVPDSILLGLE